MSLLNAPSNVSFSRSDSTAPYFKAFTHFMTAQTQIHSDKSFARYLFNGVYKSLTYSDVDRIATNVACTWAKDIQNTKVVSFLSDHTVDYLISMLAILKLRTTMLTISPRNSEAADVDLLEKTQSKLLIAHVKYEEIAKTAASKVDGVKLVIINSFDLESLVKEPLNPDYEKILDLNFSDEDINKSALIIHSSGTTSFPKPIYLSNRYLFMLLTLLHISAERNKDAPKLDSNDVFLSCTPLFHIFGFLSIFSMVSVGGGVIFLEKLPSSPEENYQAIVKNRASAMCAPPLILEQMVTYVKQKSDFSALQDLKYILFGGAPLKKEAGEWFRSNGVNVRNGYGATEIGAIMIADLDPKSENWNSLSPLFIDDEGKPYGCFEVNDPSDPDVYHFYVRPGYPGLADVSNREGGGYNTNDLFKANLEFPGYYTYIGRRDDTLIMENGENTNPVPMEATLRQSDMIKQAAVLGQARPCTAALIELNTPFALDYSPDEIIQEVHNAVKQVNAECPGHSVILPQMVKILPLSRSLPSTDKGTVQRKKAERMYQDDVDKMYKDFLEGPSNPPDAASRSVEQTQDVLITCVSRVLNLARSDIKDFDLSVFDLGLTSVTAIQLRHCLSESFDNISPNFLFEHPSINSMCKVLTSGDTEDLATTFAKRAQRTKELAMGYINKAKTDFPVARNDYDENAEQVILLTGVTGTLGSFMLAYFLNKTNVKKVYCCIRGQEDRLFARLQDAFTSRSLDDSLLTSDRVEVLPFRFNEPLLGFSKARYEQLRAEVTMVQHCAWLLDFNMPVDHYDKECIAPFYNLLKFAYKSVNPMHVHFVSSVSASAAYGPDIPEEPLPLDPGVTMPMGYAQSKFIVEVLSDYLTTEKNFPCYIERLGQVCGDSVNGVWNTTEQYPLMFIGGGSVMHKMPALDTTVDWISVDYAAETICKVMLCRASSSASRDESVYHIVNPRLVSWSDVLQAMVDAGMQFETVSPLEWVESLAKDNPAYTLMSFYDTNFRKSSKMPVWKTEKTAIAAPVIKNTPVLDSALFAKCLSRWQSIGFYNPSA